MRALADLSAKVADLVPMFGEVDRSLDKEGKLSSANLMRGRSPKLSVEVLEFCRHFSVASRLHHLGCEEGGEGGSEVCARGRCWAHLGTVKQMLSRSWSSLDS